MVHKALHRKLKIEQHEPRRVCSFCSTSGTCRVTHVKNLVISHTWGKDEIQIWQRHSVSVNQIKMAIVKLLKWYNFNFFTIPCIQKKMYLGTHCFVTSLFSYQGNPDMKHNFWILHRHRDIYRIGKCCWNIANK